MGSCDFGTIAIGRFKTVDEAFRSAQDSARYEHGSDSYNGTISTVDKFTPVHTRVRYGTKAFREYRDKRLYTGGIQKWECEYVEIKGKKLKELKDRHQFLKGAKNVKAYYFFGLAAC